MANIELNEQQIKFLKEILESILEDKIDYSRSSKAIANQIISELEFREDNNE